MKVISKKKGNALDQNQDIELPSISKNNSLE